MNWEPASMVSWLRAVADLAHVGVVLYEDDCKVLYASDRAHELLGVPPGGDVHAIADRLCREIERLAGRPFDQLEDGWTVRFPFEAEDARPIRAQLARLTQGGARARARARGPLGRRGPARAASIRDALPGHYASLWVVDSCYVVSDDRISYAV
jgi:PAS domain-containing protein